MFDFPLAVDPVTLAAVSTWFPALRPPPRLSLADWAAENSRLYNGSQFKPYPYQVEILNAMADPEVEVVTLMKSARVALEAAVGTPPPVVSATVAETPQARATVAPPAPRGNLRSRYVTG